MVALNKGNARLLGLGVIITTSSAVIHVVGAGKIVPFMVTGVGLAVLASIVGRSVDRLGDRLGSGATGFLQSALGNLPQLFIGMFALRAKRTSSLYGLGLQWRR